MILHLLLIILCITPFISQGETMQPQEHVNSTHKQTKNLINIGDIYEHYKGNRYKVIAVGRHTDDLAWVVVYECLYENPVSQIWIRPMEQFLENVTIEGKTMPRFRHIGQK